MVKGKSKGFGSEARSAGRLARGDIHGYTKVPSVGGVDRSRVYERGRVGLKMATDSRQEAVAVGGVYSEQCVSDQCEIECPLLLYLVPLPACTKPG